MTSNELFNWKLILKITMNIIVRMVLCHWIEECLEGLELDIQEVK